MAGGLTQYQEIMFKIDLIPHKDIADEQLKEIIFIKSTAWPHSFDKQVSWIFANIKESDIHVLLSLNEKKIAYLNLVKIGLSIDNRFIEGYGIGNVCSTERGKGWGRELMTQTNTYLIQNNKTGLLFCKETLVNFYNLNNWILIAKEKLKLSFNNDSVETMIFNCKYKFHRLEYFGKSF